MGTTLHTLTPNEGATKNRKRIGRGIGSRTGKTSGKGVKGQKARTGHHGAIRGFEGGQMPMQRRLPKRGFKNAFRVEYYPVNLGQLAELGIDTVDRDSLIKAGLMPRKAQLLKILGDGEVGNKKITVRAHAFSQSAQEKITKAGGVAEIVARPATKVAPAARATSAPKKTTQPKGKDK